VPVFRPPFFLHRSYCLSDRARQSTFDDPHGKSRPRAEADEHIAATGTPWATDTALDILDDGGNAFDASVAALLSINVTFGEAASFPGIAPVVVYDADEDEHRSYTGAGTAPGAATVEHFREQGHETMPELSIESQLLPASPDVAVELLKEHGTMSFGDVVEPAIETAREGFPVHRTMLGNLDLSLVERLAFYVLMPYNVKVYFGGQWWRSLHHSERFRLPTSPTLSNVSRRRKARFSTTAEAARRDWKRYGVSSTKAVSQTASSHFTKDRAVCSRTKTSRSTRATGRSL